MTLGDLLTRVTVWGALVGYLIGIACYLHSRRRRSWDSAARLAWTFACGSLIAHVASAFHFYHGWSHDAAYRETARQTAEVVGFDWGGGLYINYLLVAGWVGDVIWWWQGLDSYRRRPVLLVAAWQGFLFFILFNATVVFETGALRWIALLLSVALALLWWRSTRLDHATSSTEHREPVSKDQTHELTRL
jgi:hypothetical protein